MEGTKLILIEVENVTFFDFSNYFSLALTKSLRAFALTKFNNDYFPMSFIKLKQSCDGPILSIEFYNPNSKKMRNSDIGLKEII